jgi:hypothetical protein
MIKTIISRFTNRKVIHHTPMRRLLKLGNPKDGCFIWDDRMFYDTIISKYKTRSEKRRTGAKIADYDK